MPYKLSENGLCIHKLNGDGTLGDVVKCHKTHQDAIAHMRALYMNVGDAAMKEFTFKATAEDNNLPDSAFLYVEDGGKKDDEGKTVPRSLRHLPYKTASGAIDAARLRNALSRLGQMNTGDTGGDRWLTSSLRDSLRAKAEKILASVNAKQKEINYRVSQKSIMDAPNLRGDDIQRCFNCKYAQPIVTDEMMDSPMPMSDMTMMETQKDMTVALVCTQYDFQTESEWVCDGYEAIPPMSDMMTMKQADGHYRWFGISSTAYQDRDGEIVSQKALEQDTERMNSTGNFGSADWWHTPIDLATCDVSYMDGQFSIESGVFHDDWVGEQFSKMKGLGMSRTFYNPANEPDDDGVYHNIKTFKRAFLPEERASNRLTLVEISAKEKQMTITDKVQELAKKFMQVGVPETVAQTKAAELIKGTAELKQGADQAGLTAKETQPTPQPENIEAKGDGPESKTASWFVADMTPDEFDQRLQQAVEKFLTPAVKEIGAQVAQMNEAQAVTAKEQGDKLAAQIKSAQDMQTDIAARVAALEGLKPRGYRPTEDPKTQVDPVTAKEKAPKGDKQADASLAAWLAQS